MFFIPVTGRVKGYTRFVGKYVTGRRKRFRPHNVYIFLIPEIPAQRKFISARCHAQSNARKPQKTVASTVMS